MQELPRALVGEAFVDAEQVVEAAGVSAVVFDIGAWAGGEDFDHKRSAVIGDDNVQISPDRIVIEGEQIRGTFETKSGQVGGCASGAADIEGDIVDVIGTFLSGGAVDGAVRSVGPGECDGAAGAAQTEDE